MGKARVGGSVEIGAFATHGISKAQQQPVFVSGSFTPLTTDAHGFPLGWPYRLVAELGSLTSGVWKNAAQLGHSDPFETLYKTTQFYGVGSTTHGQPKAFSETLWTPFESGLWDVRVMLWGSESDSQVNPVSETAEVPWIATLVAFNDHLSAVDVSAFLGQIAMGQKRLYFRSRRSSKGTAAPEKPRFPRYPTQTVIPTLIGEVPDLDV